MYWSLLSLDLILWDSFMTIDLIFFRWNPLRVCLDIQHHRSLLNIQLLYWFSYRLFRLQSPGRHTLLFIRILRSWIYIYRLKANNIRLQIIYSRPVICDYRGIRLNGHVSTTDDLYANIIKRETAGSRTQRWGILRSYVYRSIMSPFREILRTWTATETTPTYRRGIMVLRSHKELAGKFGSWTLILSFRELFSPH